MAKNTITPPATSENNIMANSTIADIIGNKEDCNLAGPGLDSLYGIAGFMAYYHTHDSAKIYPELANPVTLTADSSAWTYGSWVEIIPADTITEPFDIHWVLLSSISANGNYTLQLGAGDSGSEEVIGTIGYNRNAVQSQEGSQPVQIPHQASNKRIAARIASGNANADTTDIKLYYHEYPTT